MAMCKHFSHTLSTLYARLMWHALYVSGFHVGLVGFEVEL